MEGTVWGATALRFAAEGAQVVVADIIDELGEETAQMVNDEGGSAFVHCDAVSVNDNHAMAAHAVETYGGLDILVTPLALVILIQKR